MLFGLFKKNRSDLNLIPEEQQKSRTTKLKVLTIVGSAVVIGGAVLLFIASIFIVELEKNTQKNLEQEKAEKLQDWESVSEVADSAKNIKNTLATYQSYTNANPALRPSIEKILDNLPSGLKTTSIALTNAGEVSIDGTVVDPSVLYQLVTILQADQDSFSDLNIGAVGLSGGNYTFTISFTVK